jgi:hypothetical protein
MDLLRWKLAERQTQVHRTDHKILVLDYVFGYKRSGGGGGEGMSGRRGSCGGEVGLGG